MGQKGSRCLAVVRLRGSANISYRVEDMLRMLHLTRVNHATLIDDRPSYMGMLQKVKDYVTWGEVDAETVSLLLRERGRLEGNKKLRDEYVREELKYGSIEELAKEISELRIDFNKIPGLKPVFRLHPKKGGFRKSKKGPYPHGELGYRGKVIGDLLAEMV